MSVEAHGNLSGKRIVIFGCGYVGAAIAQQARDRGMRVTALTRNAVKAAALAAQGIEPVVADLAADGWHERIAGGAEFVLNCVSSGGGGLENYRRSYVAGMKSILAWARRGPVGTFVYTSSTSVYPQDGGTVVDETAPTEPAGETARVLLEAETLLLSHAGACARWFVLRLAGIYGPGRHRLLDQVRAGEAGGRRQDHLNLIHRDDICAAIWAAQAAPAESRDLVFNVTDDAASTRGEVVDWLASHLHVPSPGFTGSAASGRRAPTPDRIIANARLKQVLGWRPLYPSFRDGYSAMLGLKGTSAVAGGADPGPAVTRPATASRQNGA